MFFKKSKYWYIVQYSLLLISLAMLSVSKAQSERKQPYYLRYTFEKKDSNTVTVIIKYRLGKAKVSRLVLPNSYAGTDSLFKCIKNLRGIGNGVKITPTSRPDSFIVNQNDLTEAIVSYEIEQDWTGEINDKVYFRPIIRDDLFYISANCGLIYPVVSDSIVLDASIEYKGFAKDNICGNGFYVNAITGKFKATINQIINSVYFSGKMRFIESEVNGGKLRLTIYENYAFSDEALREFISKIINQERLFWNAKKQPDFLVTLIPVTNVSGGTAYHNSFTLFYSRLLKLDQGLTYLIAHEYMHTWLGGGGLKQQKVEELDKWFIEGFCDYYTYRFLYEVGEYTTDGYIDHINSLVRSYFTSPVVTIQNDQFVGNYFANAHYRVLAYNRGHIIAFILNNIFEKKNQLFDDFIRQFYIRSSDTKTFNAERFYRDLALTVGEDTKRVIQELNNGDTSKIGLLLNKKGYKTVLQDLRLFELGFDLTESRKGKVIKGLIKGSAAEQAGLREGMELSRYSVSMNDPYKLAKITVKENERTISIEFYPAKKSGIYIPQLLKE